MFKYQTVILCAIVILGVILLWRAYYHIDFFANSTSQKLPTAKGIVLHYNTEPHNVMTVMDNIPIGNGLYMSVFQCGTITMDNGDIYNSIGQLLKVSAKPQPILATDMETPSLNLVVKGAPRCVEYSLLWSSQYLNKPPQQDFSIWRPIAPLGFKALGDICVLGFSAPSGVNAPVCLPIAMLEESPVLKNLLLDVDYKRNSMDYMLKCWNVSSHQFFRCSGYSAVSEETDSDDILKTIYNVKQSVLHGDS